MASRRMFATAVVEYSSFLRMPLSTQALYFHLGLNADDDGIVDAWGVARLIGSSEDDFKLLIAKGYIVPLEDMLIWIRHFSINNTLNPSKINYGIHRRLLLKTVPDAPLVWKKEEQEKLDKFIGHPEDLKNEMMKIFNKEL